MFKHNLVSFQAAPLSVKWATIGKLEITVWLSQLALVITDTLASTVKQFGVFSHFVLFFCIKRKPDLYLMNKPQNLFMDLFSK